MASIRQQDKDFNDFLRAVGFKFVRSVKTEKESAVTGKTHCIEEYAYLCSKYNIAMSIQFLPPSTKKLLKVYFDVKSHDNKSINQNYDSSDFALCVLGNYASRIGLRAQVVWGLETICTFPPKERSARTQKQLDMFWRDIQDYLFRHSLGLDSEMGDEQ